MGCVSPSSVAPDDIPAVFLLQQEPLDKYAPSTTPRSSHGSVISLSPHARPLTQECPSNPAGQNVLAPSAAAAAADGVNDAAASVMNTNGGDLRRETATTARSAGQDSLSDNQEMLALVAAASAAAINNDSFGSQQSERSGCSLSMTPGRGSPNDSGTLLLGLRAAAAAAAGLRADISTSLGGMLFSEEPCRQQQRPPRSPLSVASVARCIAGAEQQAQEDDGRAAPINMPNQIPDAHDGSGVSSGVLLLRTRSSSCESLTADLAGTRCFNTTSPREARIFVFGDHERVEYA